MIGGLFMRQVSDLVCREIQNGDLDAPSNPIKQNGEII